MDHENTSLGLFGPYGTHELFACEGVKRIQVSLRKHGDPSWGIQKLEAFCRSPYNKEHSMLGALFLETSIYLSGIILVCALWPRILWFIWSFGEVGAVGVIMSRCGVVICLHMLWPPETTTISILACELQSILWVVMSC